MRTSNPALSAKTFQRFGTVTETDDLMTVSGTVNKTLILLGLMILSASWVWGQFYKAIEAENVEIISRVQTWMIGGAICGLILALVTIFIHRVAPFTAPLYALAEGLFLGGLSAYLDLRYPGIVIQAAALTFGTLFCLLLAYKTGIIRATPKFKRGIIAATGGIFLIYIVSMIMGFFGTSIPYIHEGGMLGIGFSLFVVVIAALNLVLDFDFIEQGAAQGAPKNMEWVGSVALLITLVWLYIEILILLSKLRGRD